MRRSDGDMTSFLLNARKELSSTKASIDKKVTGIEARVVALDQLRTVIKTDSAESKSSGYIVKG